MKEVKESIEINATSKAVWEVLVDFSSYPKWNPFIIEMKGLLKVGSTFDVVVRPPGRDETRFTSKVTDVKKGRGMVFNGTIKKGLVSEVHVFSLEEIDLEKTVLFQSIVFKGIMIPLIGSTIKDCQKGLYEMNQALKLRCESRQVNP